MPGPRRRLRAAHGGVAEPLLTGLRGVALLSGLALGAVGWEDVRDLVPVDVDLEPDPRHRATYDTLFSEFTGLYRSQRRMFARLDHAVPASG